MTNRNRIFINELQYELIGKIVDTPNVVKINGENLRTNGEICFPANLLAWRGLISSNVDTNNCRNILDYYLRRKNYETGEFSDEEITKKAEEIFIFESEKWSMPVRKCLLKNGKISLFLNQRKVVETAVKEVAKVGSNYGKKKFGGKRINMKITEDGDSELTTARLRLIEEVTERILRIQGFEIVDGDADVRYLLTTKSEGPIEKDYERCVCGVVKNRDSNTKETSLTWKSYVDRKIEELNLLADEKFSEANENLDFERIARAVVIFELLAVKPSRPVFVGCGADVDNAVSSSKGGSFVLYNAARISAILERFEELERVGTYPKLLDIDNVDFEELNQEEEWDLVYNFIVGYPEIIEKCVRNEQTLETSPQTLCLFLSRFSQRFSVYYRRIRILTEGRDHLLPTMMARLHLLRALRIVVSNSLAILNIVPLRRM